MRTGRSGKDGLGLTTYNAGEVKIPRSLENCQVLSISLYFNHIFSFDVLMPTWLLVLKKPCFFYKDEINFGYIFSRNFYNNHT